MDRHERQVKRLRAGAAAGTVAGALALCAAPAALACGEALHGTTSRIAGDRYELVYAAAPSPIEPGKFFALDVAICPRGGAEAPAALTVDAAMPEHRHGMNYRPEVAVRGAGTWRVEGLMFHMPGRWDITFSLVTSAGTERLTATTRIE